MPAIYRPVPTVANSTPMTPIPNQATPAASRRRSVRIGRFQFDTIHCMAASVVFVIAVCLIIIGLTVYVPLYDRKWNEYHNPSPYISDLQPSHYTNAAVTVDVDECANVASAILRKNGSAVDAAIAAMFCQEVINPGSSGMGGGFFMTIYNRTTRKAEVLDARETAPMAATTTMFAGRDAIESRRGPLSIAVPGQLCGLEDAFKKYSSGKVTWRELVEPAIKMARDGVKVTKYFARKLAQHQESILAEESLKSVFVNNETGNVLQEGDLMKRPQLAATLEEIARVKSESFYLGALGDRLVKDIQSWGGIVTKEDLKKYMTVFREPLKTKFQNDKFTLHTPPPPASGLTLLIALQIINQLGKSIPVCSWKENTQLHHWFVEAMKYGFAARAETGDPLNDPILIKNLTNFLQQATEASIAERAAGIIEDTERALPPESYTEHYIDPRGTGTSHINVIAPNGDAVSVTASVNTFLGSMKMSPSTGIILNSHMDDFSSPNQTNYFDLRPNEFNYIKPGKRPLSSMAPTIVTESETGDVVLVIGGNGGSRIPSAITTVLMRLLFMCQSLKQSTDAKRIHHQIFPNAVLYENGFPQIYLDELESIYQQSVQPEKKGSNVYSIFRIKSSSDYDHEHHLHEDAEGHGHGEEHGGHSSHNSTVILQTMLDYRKGGSVDGF